MQCRRNELALQVKNIQGDLRLLKKRIELKDANHACDDACGTENNRLREDLAKANNTINELQAKISKLENDKSSLTTVIRILQEDNAQGIKQDNTANENSWIKINLKKAKKRKPWKTTQTEVNQTRTEANVDKDVSTVLEETKDKGTVNQGSNNKGNNTK